MSRSTADAVDNIYVSAYNSDLVKQATEEIAAVLRENHHTAVGLDDFTIISQDDIFGYCFFCDGDFHCVFGGDCGDQFVGWRNRDYEYYVGECDRTYAGDWVAQGFGVRARVTLCCNF